MVQLVEVTEDEDIYYHFIFHHYIRCPRTRAFLYKEHEEWPLDKKSTRMDFAERNKLKQAAQLNCF